MKRFLPFLGLLISSLLFVNCRTSNSMLREGDFDGAVRQAVKRLGGNPTNAKQLAVLKEAYPKAQSNDIERINFLKQSGMPDIWPEVYSRYVQLKDRQQLLKNLPSLPFSLPFINYDAEIIDARSKSAEFYFARAQKELATNDKYEARKAYSDFQRAGDYIMNYKNSVELMNKAQQMGISYVLFSLENRSETPLPPRLEDDLLKITVQDLNSKWVRYFTNKNAMSSFDFVIKARIKSIAIGPEAIKENNFSESKEVEDGFNYKLDAKGNVMKDANGNDIKTPKFKTIRCDVKVVDQHKECRVFAEVEYYNTDTRQLIKVFPVTADNIFNNHSGIPLGDVKALSDKTKALLGGQFLPFPNNADMLLQSGATLKKLIKDIVWNHCELVN